MSCLLVLLMFMTACNSVNEDEVKKYLANNPRLFGLSSLPPERVIVDEMKVIDAFNPFEADVDETFGEWVNNGFSKIADDDEITLESLERGFTSSKNNCKAVLVKYHYKKTPDYKACNILFMKEGKIIRHLDEKSITTIEKKANRAAFRKFIRTVDSLLD